MFKMFSVMIIALSFFLTAQVLPVQISYGADTLCDCPHAKAGKKCDCPKCKAGEKCDCPKCKAGEKCDCPKCKAGKECDCPKCKHHHHGK